MKDIDEDLCKRIVQIRTSSGLNKSKFAELVKSQHSVISEIEKFNREPSKAIIIELITNCNINSHWLLTGEGEMYQTSETKKTTTEVPAIPGISADEREAIRLLRENPELIKLNKLYAHTKTKGNAALEGFAIGLQACIQHSKA